MGEILKPAPGLVPPQGSSQLHVLCLRDAGGWDVIVRVKWTTPGLVHGEVALTAGSEESVETAKLCPQDNRAHQGPLGAEGSKQVEHLHIDAFKSSKIQ